MAEVESNIVGFFTKAQPALDTKTGLAYPTGIISFQWDKVDGTARKLNGLFTCSVMGTAFNHGEDDDVTKGWQNSAPKIQVRRADGGYTIRYYADDAWDEDNEISVPGWCAAEDGVLDKDLTVSLGQGAWVSCPVEDGVFTIAGSVATTELAVGGDSSGATILAGGGFPVAFQINDANAVTWTCTPGTAFNHGEDEDVTKGWQNNAPKLQIRRADGGYTIRYYADDAWDEDKEVSVPGWCAAEDGVLDKETMVAVGGGFWMNTPLGDKTIYVTVKNPIK